MSVGNVYARGWVPHTCIAMSSSIRISAVDGEDGEAKQIGVIQSFRPADTRRTERARGVGYGDRVAEIVPGTTDVSIAVTRMCLYTKNVLEVFGYTTGYNKGGSKGLVRTLAHTKNPFDVLEAIWFHEQSGDFAGVQKGGGAVPLIATGGKDVTVTIYHDCWLSSWTRTIDITGNLILMEDVAIEVTWVSDGVEPGPYAATDNLPNSPHGIACGGKNGGRASAFDLAGIGGRMGAGTTAGHLS